jgi:hypothetical protein
MLASTSPTHVGQNVIAFAFAIGDRVRLVDAECFGRVKQVCASSAGREYQVAYFDEDKVRRLEWLGEEELSRG